MAELEDDRLETGMDLEPEQEPQYLRRQKRVEVRKRLDSRKLARLKIPLLSMIAVLALGGVAWGISRFALDSTTFSFTVRLAALMLLPHAPRTTTL